MTETALTPFPRLPRTDEFDVAAIDADLMRLRVRLRAAVKDGNVPRVLSTRRRIDQALDRRLVATSSEVLA